MGGRVFVYIVLNLQHASEIGETLGFISIHGYDRLLTVQRRLGFPFHYRVSSMAMIHACERKNGYCQVTSSESDRDSSGSYRLRDVLAPVNTNNDIASIL